MLCVTSDCIAEMINVIAFCLTKTNHSSWVGFYQGLSWAFPLILD